MAKLFSTTTIVYVLLLALCFGLVFYFVHKKEQRDTWLAMDEATQLTTLIGQSVDLPPNETPIIATVTDVNVLDKRIFPGEIRDGDKILIYRVAGRVILFRPSTEKVVTSGSLPPEILFEGGMEASGQGKVAPTIAVYIATDDVAWVAETEEKLQKNFSYLGDYMRQNARLGNYTGVSIYNPSFFQSELAEKMAEVFGGTFEETIPIGEDIPSTDLLIIIGERGREDH